MLREVEGYNPQDHIIQIPDRDCKSRAYLEVCHRKDWFLRYCEQKGIVGLLDDSDVRIDREAKLVIVTGKVFMDNKLVGISTAARVYDPNYAQPTDTPVQTAGTVAIGRALANAGFGTTASYSPGEDGDILADAPVSAPTNQGSATDAIPSADNNPLLAAIEGRPPEEMNTAQTAAAAVLGQVQKNKRNQQTEEIKKDPAPQQPVNSKDPIPAAHQQVTDNVAPVQMSIDGAKNDNRALPPWETSQDEKDIPPVATKAEAYAAIIPVGVMKGRTIGEVLNTQRNGRAILFAFRKPEYASRFPELAKAVGIALNVKAG